MMATRREPIDTPLPETETVLGRVVDICRFEAHQVARAVHVVISVHGGARSFLAPTRAVPADLAPGDWAHASLRAGRLVGKVTIARPA